MDTFLEPILLIISEINPKVSILETYILGQLENRKIKLFPLIWCARFILWGIVKLFDIAFPPNKAMETGVELYFFAFLLQGMNVQVASCGQHNIRAN